MKKRTFDEQMTRVVAAYHKGLLNPYCRMHCFIAHLLGFKLWDDCDELHEVDGHQTALSLETSECVRNTKNAIYKESQGLYELADIARIERSFLEAFQEHLDRSAPVEDALYNALIAGVQELKAVHESKGETCYYEPIAKAGYEVVHEGGPTMDIIWKNLLEDIIGGFLIALFGGEQEEDDKVRRHREMLRRQQRFN